MDEKTSIENKIDKLIKDTYTSKFIESLSSEYTIPKYGTYKSPIYELTIGDFNYYRFVIEKSELFFNKNYFEVKVIFCNYINGSRFLFLGRIDERTSSKLSYIVKDYTLFKGFGIKKNIRKVIKEMINITDDCLVKENFEKFGIDLNLIERRKKLEKIKEKIKMNNG